jgi:hypothetical protein
MWLVIDLLIAPETEFEQGLFPYGVAPPARSRAGGPRPLQLNAIKYFAGLGRRFPLFIEVGRQLEGVRMSDQTAGHRPTTALKEIILYAILLGLSFVFFAAVRNNTFWHSSDYFYLLKALRIERDWREIFTVAPLATFQPLVNAVFYMEFRLFGDDATGYYFFNVVVHSLNSFLVYRVVYTLLRDRTIAVMSGVLFALAVGNYGKAVMVVSGISDVLITLLTLMTLLLFFRNELGNEGRLNTKCFWGTLVFFALSLLSKATSFSILGCMLAFNLFFRPATGRRVFGKSFLVVSSFALAVLVIKLAVLAEYPGESTFGVSGTVLIKNYARYLVRMVFPIQASGVVRDSGPVVKFVYQLATEIRIVTFLCILSYSVFGFVFGNKAIRFFIAWTYITVTPFCFFHFPADWFNIRYLYLVSIGFVMILASGTALAARLLYEKAWRRFIPYVVPLFFVFLSQFIIQHLDRNYERKGRSKQLDTYKQQFLDEYEKRGRK